MTFKDFVNIIYPVLSEGNNLDEFAKKLFEEITDYEYGSTNPITRREYNTFGKYCDGSNQISKLAKEIGTHIDVARFETYLCEFPDNVRSNLYEVLSPHIPDIEPSNVVEKCTDTFRQIILDSARQKRKKGSAASQPAAPHTAPEISLDDDDEYAKTLYIDALCEIYTEHHGTAITQENIHLFKKDDNHLKRNKVDFINACVLHRKLRDTGTEGFELYQKLEDDVYRGIIDPWEEHDGETGYAHFYAVVAAVKSLQFHAFSDGPIKPFLDNSTLIGLLHMLVNHERIDGWVHHDE